MYRVRTVFTGLTGAPYLSTFYFDSSGSFTAAAANSATGAFWAAVDNQLPTSLSWSTEGTVDTINDSGELTASTAVTPVTGAGSISAVLHSTALQGLVRWSTGQFLGGREIRGRTYIPGMSNTTNDGAGGVNSSFISAVNTAATNLINDANSELRVWSRKNSASATATGGAMWTKFAVLRSRRD